MKFIFALIAGLFVSSANAQIMPTSDVLNTPIGRLSLDFLAKAYAVDFVRKECSPFIKIDSDMIQGWESEDDREFFESSVVFSLAYVKEESLKGMEQTAARYLDDMAVRNIRFTLDFFSPESDKIEKYPKKEWCIKKSNELVDTLLVYFRPYKDEEKSKFTQYTSAKTRFFQARSELYAMAPKGTN